MPITTYSYASGRLVSAAPEVEWDEEQQGYMLALKAYRDGRCPGCGGDLNVTTASEHEERYRHQPPLVCFRCVAFSQAHQAYGDQQHQGALIHLVPQKPKRAG